MSRNFKLFMGAAVTFYLAGSMNRAAALYVMAGVCLACILGSYIISRLGVEGLELSVKPKTTAVWAARDVEVELELSNIGIIPRPGVPVRVILRNTTVDTDPTTYLFGLPGLSPGQSVTTTGNIVPRCRGEHILDKPRLVGGDPLMMFERPGKPGGSTVFVALPNPAHISREDIARMLSEQARMQMASRRQQTGEFFGIRPHEPGDDLRHVHWKMAAHTGELVVRQYAGGRDYHAAVWLDTRAANAVGEGMDSGFETQIVAAASLINALSSTHLDIELFGEGLPNSLRSADRGRSAYERALFALALARATGQRSFAANTAEWASSAGHGATVFAVTSGLEPGAIAALSSVASRGVGVRAVICAGPNVDERLGAEQIAAMRRLRIAQIPAIFAKSPDELPRAFAELASIRASTGAGALS